VLCCATFEKQLVTGSKDQSVIVWNYDGSWSIQHRFKGHLGVVSAVAITQGFVLSASVDKTVKCWDLSSGSTRFTFQAHDNDINCLNLSPNNEYFVTGSLDKTAKIWTKAGVLKTVLKGHKRGIWQAKFSPVDMLVCTSSTDKSLKMWGLDGSCLKTFEGHLNSVLNFEFLSLGLQLLSAGGDGLLKLWNVRDGECVATFDDHEDRVR
jgi:U3 small nucleolar RNA-associated protein 13